MSEKQEKLAPYLDEKQTCGTMSQEQEKLHLYSDDKQAISTVTISDVAVAPRWYRVWHRDANPETSSMVQCPDGVTYFGHKEWVKPLTQLSPSVSEGNTSNHVVSVKADYYPVPDVMDDLRELSFNNFSILCLVLITAHHGYSLNLPGFSIPLPVMDKVARKPSKSLKKRKLVAIIARTKFRLKDALRGWRPQRSTVAAS